VGSEKQRGSRRRQEPDLHVFSTEIRPYLVEAEAGRIIVCFNQVRHGGSPHQGVRRPVDRCSVDPIAGPPRAQVTARP
jgi:hypothetical protein